MALTKTQISALYVSIFNRASEGQGNTYWMNQNFTMAKTAEAMLATPDAASYFGSSLDSNEAFIKHIYLNTLNKTQQQDPDGIAYWVAQLDSGVSRGQVVADLVTAVSSYADSTDPVTKAAYTQFMNRVDVSNFMADTVQETPSDYATSTSFSSNLFVDSSASSVVNAMKEIGTIKSEMTLSSTITNVLTLQKVVNETISITTDSVTTAYWGDSGTITVDQFYEMIRTVTGQDLFEFTDSMIDISGTAALTNVHLTQSGVSDVGTGTVAQLLYTTATGEQFTSELALAQEYISLLDSLIYYTDENGMKVSRFSSSTQEVTTETSSFSLAPVILTTTVNNGSTIEEGTTTAGNDLIVAGQTELLHGAYIDGGAGVNTLEVSMKGVYAQPAQLLNIQNVYVENLPNVYTDYYDLTDDSHADGYDIPDYLDLPTATANAVLTQAALNGAVAAQAAAAAALTAAIGNLDAALGDNESNDNSGNGDGLDATSANTLAALRSEVDNAKAALDAANASLAAATNADNKADMIVLQATNLVNSDSILDLSNARQIENLVITEGRLTGNNQAIGDLTVVGVRGNATTTLEGSFMAANVNVFYSQGLEDGINLTLNLGDVGAATRFSIFHESNTININSIGGGNNLVDANFGDATLMNMNISGDAKFVVSDSIAAAFTAGHPVTINASANTAGVDLTLGTEQAAFSDEIVFIGTASSDDHFNAHADRSITITGGEGDNEFHAGSDEDVTITSGNGNNQIIANSFGSSSLDNLDNLDNEDVVTVTVGDGANDITVSAVDKFVVTAGDGANRIEAIASAQSGVTEADVSTIVVGDGQNEIDVSAAMAAVTTGNGANEIVMTNVVNATVTTGSGNDVINATGLADAWGDEKITINAADGNNAITVSGFELVTIATGAGNDSVTINGGNIEFNSNFQSATQIGSENSTETMLNVNLGSGTNTLTLGSDTASDRAVTAVDGSIITGSNIMLKIESNADLSRATLTGITAVQITNADVLTLTVAQFKAIGAENFSLYGESFGANGVINLIVDENTNMTTLGLDDLPRNIDLSFEVKDAVTLTMTAQQLHERVTDGGVTAYDDNNTDFAQGTVMITHAGIGFDAFANGLTGSVDLGELGDGLNVYLDRDINGYERPANTATYTRLDINTDTDLTDGQLTAFTTAETFLRITGDSGLEMTTVKGGMDDWGTWTNPLGAITLGSGTQDFKVDFSSVEGTVEGLKFANFENVVAIYGNGGARVDVELTDDVGTDTAGLVSKGIATFVVTKTETDDVNVFYTCTTTKDLETLGLQGNHNAAIAFANVERGVDFLVEATYSKADGYGAGYLNFAYAREDTVADVAINLAEGVTLPADEVVDIAGINAINAITLNIDITAGNTVIQEIDGDDVTTLTLASTASLAIAEAIPTTLTSVDASGVAGNLTLSSEHTGEDDFTFTGSAGTTELTLTANATFSEGSSFASAGTLNLIVDDATATTPGSISVNLVGADVSGIDSVFVGEADTVTMTIAQSKAIGEANITTDATDNGTLTLVGLGEEAFSLANYDENLVSNGISLTIVDVDGDNVVTLHPDTDLTDVAVLVVPEGVTLNLTAAQVQQMLTFETNGDVDNTPAITGVESDGATVTTNFTVNITNMTQADANLGFDITDIDADNITITLAESVVFPTSAISTATANQVVTSLNPDNALTINLGDDMTLTYGEDTDDLDGVAIVGGTNTTVVLQDANDGAGIDASGFDIDELHIMDDYLVDTNIDQEFQGLSDRVTKVIYFNDGDVSAQDQTVTINESGTFNGDLMINRIEDGVEIQDLTINMLGGTILAGNLQLDSTDKDNGAELLHAHLQTLTINSSGTAQNSLSGGTANIITGNIDSNSLDADVTANNLLNVTINATQDFMLNGDLIFESVVDDDDYTLNDDTSATATLTVTGDSDVTIGSITTTGIVSGINATDEDVDAVNVVNNGTGTLTMYLIAANFNADDALSFTGTGTTNLVVTGANLDLSDADLTGVNTITIGHGNGDTDEADANDLSGSITISLAQMGTVTLVDGTDTATGAATATVNVVDVDATPFNAADLAPLNVGTITIAAGNITLDPTTDLTGVDSIIVPEGSTLNLTAEQFQQLAGTGAITGVTAAGAASSDYTVNITNLTQADVDYENDENADGDEADAGETGIDFTGITAANVTVALGEDVTLTDAVTTNVDAYTMSDDQTLTFVNSLQADGVAISGGTNTTVVFQFDAVDGTDVDKNTSDTAVGQTGTIYVAGYDVDVLKALNTFVDGENVENIIEDLSGSVELRIYNDPAELGIVSAVNRYVVVEAGVDVPGSLIFNDIDGFNAVETLNLTMEGGSSITGNIEIPTTAPDATLNARFFETLTIVSEGTETNTITGNITAAAGAGVLENNLLNVTINADADLVIGTYNATTGDHTSGGDIIMSSVSTTAAATATLTVTGTANVTMHGIDIDDSDDFTGTGGDISTLNIINNGGTLTLTGGTAAIAADNAENIVLSGTGDVLMGTDNDGVGAEGVDSNTLSSIDASGLSGALALAELSDIDSTDFAFTSGTGVTTLTLTDAAFGDASGTPTVPVTNTWSFDYADAAAGSAMRIGNTIVFDAGNDDTTNSLTIDNGANTLFIDADQNFTNLDSLSITGPIVLTAGVDITLTAAQASGLNITVDPSIILDETDPDYDAADVPSVTITGLGNAAYDFSNILAGVNDDNALNSVVATLEDNDVTIHANADLGDVAIQLTDLADLGGALNDELIGQTIRFSTEEQAARTVLATAIAGEASTNVVWLFNSVTAPVNTNGYDGDIARLWINETLANGANVENLFTSLPTTIIRVDFADLADLENQLTSVGVEREVELASFTSLPAGLIFSDQDQLEHVETLEISMGGQVTVGDIEIGNIIDNAGTYTTPVTFNSLIINSVLADDTGDLLAREGFDEEVNVKPTSGNTVGDISVGTDDNIDLTSVTLNTGIDEAFNDLLGTAVWATSDVATEAAVEVILTAAETAGTITSAVKNAIQNAFNTALTADDGSDFDTAIAAANAIATDALVNADTGTSLTVGTITFDSEVAGTVANLVLTGANDITIASIDSSDAQVYAVSINNTNTATVTVTGASPAAAVNNTESLAINNTGNGTMIFGTAGDATKPGVSSNVLSTLTVVNATGYVDLGVIASVDSNDFSLTNTGANVGATTTIDLVGAGQAGDVITVTVNGQAFTYTVDATPTLPEILTALVDAINDTATGLSTVTASDNGTDTITLNADLGITLDVAFAATDADSGNNAVIGTVTATAAPQGTVATLDGADLAADGVWSIDNVLLTIEAGSTFGAGDLTITNSTIVVNANTNLTALTSLNLGTGGTASTVQVTAGNTLTLTVAQMEILATAGIEIIGSGTVKITGDATNATDFGGVLDTAIVDYSAVTIITDPLDLDVDTDLSVDHTADDEATDDFGNITNQHIIGSAFVDTVDGDAAVTAGITVTGGAEDDVIVGASGATDTFNVTAGTDTITGLHAGMPADPIDPADEADVLVVSAGATANATTVDDFYASADTVNNGTASITTVASNDAVNASAAVTVTLDLSEVTTGNGFTLTGDDVTDGTGLVAMTIVGSSGDDVINGGDSAQTSAVAVDTLTGGDGDDTFVFNITQSTPIAMVSTTTTQGDDLEAWDFNPQGELIATGFDTNTAGDSLVVQYQNGSTLTSFIINNDLTIDFTDGDALAGLIATELSARGVAASYSAVTSILSINGTNGQSVELVSLTPATGGAWADTGAGGDDTPIQVVGYDAANDIPQETEIVIGTGGMATAIAGEVYGITVTLSEGSAIEYEYTAAGGETEVQIATALTTGLAGLAGGEFGVANGGGTSRTITITDSDGDNGGFTVSAISSGGISGTGASALGAGLGVWANIFADTITDFASGEDTIQLDIANGTNANYNEGATEASYLDAYNQAQLEMNGTVLYYLTSIDGTTGTEDATGLLFFDANADGDVDGVVLLTGVTMANFDETDIIL